MIETLVHTHDGDVCDAPPTPYTDPWCQHGRAVHTEWLLPEVPD